MKRNIPPQGSQPVARKTARTEPRPQAQMGLPPEEQRARELRRRQLAREAAAQAAEREAGDQEEQFEESSGSEFVPGMPEGPRGAAPRRPMVRAARPAQPRRQGAAAAIPKASPIRGVDLDLPAFTAEDLVLSEEVKAKLPDVVKAFITRFNIRELTLKESIVLKVLTDPTTETRVFHTSTGSISIPGLGFSAEDMVKNNG